MNEHDNEQTKLLREILKWIRFAGIKEVKDVLTSALDTDQKKIVYQHSDGSRGIAEIGKAAGISSTSTISRYWKSWSRLGLGDYVAVKGGDRFKRAFDLEDVGIEVPPPRESKPKSESAKNEHVKENSEEKT